MYKPKSNYKTRFQYAEDFSVKREGILKNKYRWAKDISINCEVAASAYFCPPGVVEARIEQEQTDWVRVPMTSGLSPSHITPLLLLWYPHSMHEVLFFVPLLLAFELALPDFPPGSELLLLAVRGPSDVIPESGPLVENDLISLMSEIIHFFASSVFTPSLRGIGAPMSSFVNGFFSLVSTASTEKKLKKKANISIIWHQNYNYRSVSERRRKKNTFISKVKYTCSK